MTVAFLFPGQGAQRAGMGLDLLDRFADLTGIASDRLGYDLRELCADQHRLGQTRYTQPATYVVNALAWRAAQEEEPIPDVVLGHSLGEYNALEAAGAFGFSEGLELVRRRADITADAADATDGAMTAVQGLEEDILRDAVGSAGLPGVELVNLNTPIQTVLAGPRVEIIAAEDLARSLGAVDVRRLPITGAFHSNHMRTAAQRFGAELAAFRFQPPGIPVIANLTARPHTVANIGASLTEQLCSPVRWHESVTWVLDRYPGVRFRQPGPSQVLVRMLRQIPGAGPAARQPLSAEVAMSAEESR